MEADRKARKRMNEKKNIQMKVLTVTEVLKAETKEWEKECSREQEYSMNIKMNSRERDGKK